MELSWADVHQSELTTHQLYAALRLRAEVFVVEQECAYQDTDGTDLSGDNRHLFGWGTPSDGHEALIAYVRLLAPGGGVDHESPDAAALVPWLDPAAVQIGRVVVSPRARGGGYGQAVMEQAIAACAGHWPGVATELGAQRYAEQFYARLGFRPVGEEYDEDGIPHIWMRREA